MPGMKRTRSDSAIEEAAVSAYVESCTHFKSNVTFTDISKASAVAPHVLLVGAPGQLKDKTVESLPFYGPAVAAAIARAKAGETVTTLAEVQGRSGYVKVSVTALPDTASRTNCPYRADSLTEAVAAACAGVGEGETLDVYVRAPAGAETAVANAVARAAPHSYTAKDGQSAKAYLKQAMTLNVVLSSRAAFTGEKVHGKAVTVAELDAICTSVQLCQRLVDTPTCTLDTIVYTEIATAYAKELGADITVIKGEELREKGYGGIYAVGKAAQYPPHLVTLRYKNPHAAAGAKNVAMNGKGIVYDCGGLALKPAQHMSNMKTDMGGSAGLFCAFIAVVRCMKLQQDHYHHIANLSVTLCMAENAMGPNAYRNDDVVIMKCGKSVEVMNTDAEGRIVLGDGVYYATGEQDFIPDEVINMATLTGAQGIATGTKHAGVYVSTAQQEAEIVKAGLASGDVCFPVLYCPEAHKEVYTSSLADMRNIANVPVSPGASLGGYFVEQMMHERFKGAFVHVDIAFPSSNKSGATGYGVSLVAEYLRKF
ncbi:aminopeptidase putativemetallo-peptidase Clan MF Family M17 [Leptomonas pyrrhocoris]|uniref:Aminopeptidase putativemetallo-peptidase Clan MF Family M17 n=1 Tax=Leptomonas pyrrhocoris TaxID=157538 RepID=A0A0M9FVL7_LEPPY|nr:aminopeptidase putativemetallo-peptidase Clan MF Family M17 [Leptomonas pyrrhocoris]KPA76995.1 aminopeptidase putativemetallo-peptidase Clan MF Family M17 [Leptomonas pyrrhocoris]|eukprot:XP_015655434.1 aminopeptidase putativemetallo-peptidase Clan MF Family M17 [Leptomonas pyrrhocoris]